MKKVILAFCSRKKIYFDLFFVVGLFCLYWILFAQKIFNTSHLTHDNFTYHFHAFYYFASSLLAGFGFPSILFDFGGSEIAITTISLGYFTPQRIFSYLLYCNSNLSPILVYKSSIIFGLFLNSVGWFWLWREVFSQSLAKYVCFTLYLFSGIGLTVWHQEQILFTLSYIPWFLISIMLVKKYGISGADAFGIYACFLGLILITHYPQIHFLMISVFILSLIGTFEIKIKKLVFLKIKLFKNLFVILLSFSPLVYIYFCAGSYGSPVRETGELNTSSLQEYINLNSLQISSAPLKYFINIPFVRRHALDDEFLLVQGIIGSILVFFGLHAILKKGGRPLPIILMLAFSSWAFLGINGGLAQILFLLKIPQISSFRQWYHFGPFIVILLITIAGFGFQKIEGNLSNHKQKFFLICLIGIITQFIFTSSKYLTVVATTKKSTEKKLSVNEFLQKILDLDFKIPPNLPGVKPLVSFKNSLEFYQENCSFIKDLIRTPATHSSTKLLITPKSVTTYADENDFIELYLNNKLIYNDCRSIQETPSSTVAILAPKNKNKVYYFVGQKFYYLILVQMTCFFICIFKPFYFKKIKPKH